ncbi:hypothetical protein HKD42_08855 [Altererythrobacter sp. RZ02]|uniref:DUF4235 domain-containing protein n=1 Tax=Pontixanthobacter rizhaonensis TaxID=2730337 RepID=A0A848QSS9_9SPHN|nr:hypothetical protein [Pontixanthobacter rizhaonensis]NMW32168.1 hypothetical protein [Pontixanthobacter rizhaonensis]
MAETKPITDHAAAPDNAAETGHPTLPDPASTLRLVLGAIVMQAGTQALTKIVDQAVLGIHPDSDNTTKTPAKKPGKLKTLSSKKIAGFAAKSVPGAAVIAGGLLVKYVFDRGGQRKDRQRAANRRLPDTLQDAGPNTGPDAGAGE